MDISVIIPAYNSYHYIENAIESVINQTFQPLEIIVIDDGSIDDTFNKVKAKYPNVVLMTQDNKGPSSARNLGISIAKSKWITFLDSDDVWDKNYLKRFQELIKKNPQLNWACSSYAIKYNKSKTVVIKYNGKFYNNGIINDLFSAYKDFKYKITAELISTCAVIINKDYFSKELFFNTSFHNGEDIDLWFRLGIKENVIGYVPEIGFEYRRINNKSITASSVKSFSLYNNNIKRINASWSEVPGNDIDTQKKASGLLNIWVFRELRSIVHYSKFSIATQIKTASFYHSLSLRNKMIVYILHKLDSLINFFN